MQHPLIEKEINDIAGKKIALLISGGPDSVYLFHQFLKQRQHFTVIHCNHHLRDKESNAEECFVKQLCETHGIQCLVEHFYDLPKKGTQEVARQRRRDCMQKLSLMHGFKVYYMAHHGDDVIETLLMRVDRGVGLKGLVGIKKVQTLCDHVEIRRPLLDLFKDDIITYLNENKIPFCTDSSNKSDKYFRNRTRNELAHLNIDKKKKQTILKLCYDIQNIDAYFENRLKEELKLCAQYVPINKWQKWPEELQFRFYSHQMNKNGYQQQIEIKHFRKCQEQEVKLVLDQAVFLKDAAGCYFVTKIKLEDDLNDKTQVPVPGSCVFGILKQKVKIEKNRSFNDLLIKAPNSALFISRAKPAEKIIPFGHKSEVPIKKLFQQHQIPKYQRLFWPVLRDGKDRIIAIVGVEIDDRYRVEKEDRNVLTVRIES